MAKQGEAGKWGAPAAGSGRVEILPAQSAAQPLTTEAYRSLAAFRRLVREFLAFSSEGAKEQGVTAQQHQALLAVRAFDGAEPMSIGQLAECLLIRNHSAVGLVGRLAERGLLVRSASPADRRRVHLALTVEGERVLEAVTRRNLARLGEAADVLNDLVRTVGTLPDRG